MTLSAMYPPEYVREISMEAFEIMIARMKSTGGELADLAETVDAAFLLWQLAGEEGGMARQTISENLPFLIDVIYKARDE